MYCEIKLSTKKQIHSPCIYKQTLQAPCAVNEIEGTSWSPSICSQMALHQHRTQKDVMDPWQAPYQNSNGY
jgi:hypothetical protein